MKKNKIITYIFLAFFLFYFYSIPSYATDAAVDSGEESLAYTLSSEELQYLQDKKLKVSLISDWKPFSYSDENGAYHGLPMMILQRLSDVSGLTLEIIPAKNYEQSLEQLSTGKVDMMGMMSRYPAAQIENSEAAPLKMLPYLETQTMLIYHKNTNLSDLSQVTLADIRGRFQFTKKQNMSPFYYDSPDDCITAVRCKQADVMVCDIFTGSVRMQEYETKDLESIPSTLLMEFGFGIVPKGDSRLLSSLEKTIASFSTEDINRSLLQGISYGEEGFLEIVYRYPFEIICFMVAIMFVITLCLITYTKINIHQHQALQGYEESYRLLADTFGEAGIEYDYLNDSLTVFGKRSNLDVAPKVEDFKQNLENQTIRILLTVEQLERILKEGADNQSFVAEFQCGIKSGEWIWYRLIYTVVCTTESHRRPIRLVGCLTNIEKEHAEKEQLMKLSSDDQLTGLFNRTTGEKRIRQLLAQEMMSHVGILAILDIDYFKNFNDRMGHLCGDDVLRNLGEALRDIFSKEDSLCRWGGDEFLFFCVDDQVHGEKFMEKIQRLQRKMSQYQYGGIPTPVTLSIGITTSYPGCTFDTLFQQADDALYLAKKKGRNQWKIYMPPTGLESVENDL